MKLIFRVFVLFCLFYRIVNGGKINKVYKQKETQKEIISLEVDPVDYGPEQNFLEDGSSKKIVCRGSHRNQKIEWYDPSGEVIPRGGTHEVFVQDTFAPSLKTKAPALVLVFSRAHVEDSGIWECRSGELKQQVPLCVLDPVEFDHTPEEVTMEEGRSITLTCGAKGNPEPKIVWKRDEEELSEDDEKIYTSTKYNQQGIEGQLTIKSLTAEDSGTYTCEATQSIPDFENCNNTVTTNITLNVNRWPKFTNVETLRTTFKYIVYVFSTFNETVALRCEPNAYPTPKFRWFTEIGNMLTEYSDKQFKVTDDGTESLLSVVANASTFDQRFRCLAKNDFGETELLYELKELTKPSEIREFYIADATHNKIVLNITVREDVADEEFDWKIEVLKKIEVFPVDGFDIQYLEKRLPGSPREEHWKRAKMSSIENEDSVVQAIYPNITLQGLKSHTEYWVRVRAFNDLGTGPWSFPLLASTTKEEPQPIVYTPTIADTTTHRFGILEGILLTIAIAAFGGICISIIKCL